MLSKVRSKSDTKIALTHIFKHGRNVKEVFLKHHLNLVHFAK